MTASRVRVGVLGTADGLLLGRFLRAMLDAGCVVDAVLLDPTPTAARDVAIHRDRTGDALPPIPLHDFESAAPPCYFLSSHNAPAAGALVRRLGLDWLVNGGTPRILTAATLDAPRQGVLNCHPGLLPAFRGASAVEWALFLNEPVGNTVHKMTAGIDQGPVLMQRPVRIGARAGYQDVRIATYRDGFALMAEAVLAVQTRNQAEIVFRPQQSGRSFRPIDPRRLAAAKQRLAEGRYDGTAPLGLAPVPEPEAT